MGYELHRHCQDHAPAELGTPARLVLLIIADDAHEQTRLSWIGQELLCHRTGLGPDAVRKALVSLAKAGYEIRQPLTTDAKGRPVYAVRGRRTVYRVPTFAARDVPGKPSESSAHSEGESPDDRPQSPANRPPMPGESSGPPPQSPQDSPQSVPCAGDEDPAAAAAEELLAQTGRTVDHEWGQRVAADLLAAARGPVKREANYVRRAIRARADAKRAMDLLPTPGPRRLEEVDAPPVLPVPDPPAETAPCGHGWPADDAENCFVCAKERRGSETGPAATEPTAEPPEEPRPGLTVHTGQSRPNRRHNPGQAPLLTTVPTEQPAQPTAAPRTPAEWAAIARAGLATGTDNTT